MGQTSRATPSINPSTRVVSWSPYVDFSVGDSRMRVIQHIAYDHDRDILLARYMDTMGDEATYAWVFDDRKIRVSFGDKNSDTYFEATLNEDHSQYIGTWHYPDRDSPDPAENIVYTRVQNTGEDTH
ncbi:MAG TPA: hypothetical protein VF165_17465 [Nocardioidaceae bacterium]